MVCYMHFTKMGDRKILQQINKIRKFFAKKYRLKIFFKKKSLLSSQNNTLNFCKNYTNFALFLYFDTVLLAICIPSDSRISTISLSVNFLLLLERISETEKKSHRFDTKRCIDIFAINRPANCRCVHMHPPRNIP